MRIDFLPNSVADLRRNVFSFLLVFAACVCSAGTAGSAPQADAGAKTDESKQDKPITLVAEGKRPLLTITFASVNRFLDETRYVFDAAGKPETFKTVETFLGETLNNLDGFNRDKPFGVMGYLPVAIPPMPEFIAFVPVDSVDSATKLIEKAPVVIRQKEEEGRYEIIGPNRTLPMMMKDGYAFLPLGNDPPEEALDRDLPDPSELLASQTQQFDMSIRLDVDSIPPATRTLLMTLITTGISTQLQQRDGEPEGAYMIRRTEGERGLAALKMLINDTQKLTFGVNVEQAEHAVNLDLVVDAREGSEFLKEIFQSTEKPSYFIPLLDEAAAVSLSMSSSMAERDRTAYTEMMDGIKLEVTRLIEENKLGAVPDENSPIGQALSAVQKTIEAGHVDVFAQFYRDSDGKLAIVWAGRIEDGDAISAGLVDVATRLKDIEEIQKAGELQIGAGEHNGVTLHRLVFAAQPSEAVAVFGEKIGLTIGVGSQVVWGAIGGENSVSTLTGVMDKLEEASKNPVERTTPPNFRVIVNVNQLVEMADIAGTAGTKAREEREKAAAAEQAAKAATEKPVAEKSQPAVDPGRAARREAFRRRQERGGKIMKDTLAEGDDRIEIDSRLTDTGMRSRVRLEEGFVKIFGRLIADRVNPEPALEEVQTTSPPQTN